MAGTIDMQELPLGRTYGKTLSRKLYAEKLHLNSLQRQHEKTSSPMFVDQELCNPLGNSSWSQRTGRMIGELMIGKLMI